MDTKGRPFCRFWIGPTVGMGKEGFWKKKTC
jgi:hypothetical protein